MVGVTRIREFEAKRTIDAAIRDAFNDESCTTPAPHPIHLESLSDRIFEVLTSLGTDPSFYSDASTYGEGWADGRVVSAVLREVGVCVKIDNVPERGALARGICSCLQRRLSERSRSCEQ